MDQNLKLNKMDERGDILKNNDVLLTYLYNYVRN